MKKKRWYDFDIPEPLFAFILVYIASMLIFPLIASGGNLEYLHGVWHNWQTLNAGILAFLAALVGLYLARLNAEEYRQRKLSAAKAFLPNTLSDLNTYFKCSADFYVNIWDKSKLLSSDCTASFLSVLPLNSIEIFSRCVEYGDSDFSKYITYILNRLQIHHSRITGIEDIADSLQYSNLILDSLYRLCELYALVIRLYPFLRDDNKSLDDSSLRLDEVCCAFRMLELDTTAVNSDEFYELAARQVEGGCRWIKF